MNGLRALSRQSGAGLIRISSNNEMSAFLILQDLSHDLIE